MERTYMLGGLLLVLSLAAVGEVMDANRHYQAGMDAYMSPHPKISQAIGFFTQAVAIDSTFTSAYLMLGLAAADSGDGDAAFRYVSQAIALEPKNPYFYVCRGHINRQLGAHRSAQSDFEKALSIDRNFAESYILTEKSNRKFKSYLGELASDYPVTHCRVTHIDPDSVVFLDAREREEYDVSHIPDAIWVGYKTFDLEPIQSLPRGSEVVVYCSVGYRSSIITERLNQAGFHRASNLLGGIFDWANHGRPLKAQTSFTNRVHTYNKKWSQYLTNHRYLKCW